MQLEFRIRKGNLLDSVREYAQRRLHLALDRYGNRIGRVTVRITDLNGPRGGIDKECRISVQIVPSGVLVLEELLIPMKVGTDSDLIPVTRSDAMAVRFGAKRRWRFYGA